MVDCLAFLSLLWAPYPIELCLADRTQMVVYGHITQPLYIGEVVEQVSLNQDCEPVAYKVGLSPMNKAAESFTVQYKKDTAEKASKVCRDLRGLYGN